jgi:ABC-2 type transport system ATP-binding protein/lipopolysaccharide transport system ATP-binding protein
MSRYAIRAENLSKRFWLYGERHTSLKQRVVRGKLPKGREFWALRDASFEIERGSTFGLMGQNGSGKSTTLKVLAGIYRPTSGSVVVDGRVSALLELGAGFHGDLTGRENIRLNGAILGLSGKQITSAMDQILDFAGIGEFIDLPVKIYSSGMFVRLAFAVAVSLDPEILMVDEVIAVGDEEFQRKCFDHLFDLRKRGTTIVLVTHSLGLIRDMCDQAMWLEHGQIRGLGPAVEVADAYIADVNEREVQAHQVTSAEASPSGESKRLGSGEVRITSLEFLDGDGKPSPVLLAGAPCTIRMHYSSQEQISHVIFGLGFLHESGANVSGPNSGRRGSWAIEAGSGYVDFVVEELLLQPGTYQVSTAIVDRGHTFDYADREFDLRVRGRGDQEPGLTRMPGTWNDPVRVTAERQVNTATQENFLARS